MNFTALIRPFARRNIRNSVRARRTPWRPRLEALEDRAVPTSGPSPIQVVEIGTTGTFELRVTGNIEANEVTLTNLGPAEYNTVPDPGGDSFDVAIDGAEQTVSHVVQVVINTGGGDDAVTVSGQFQNVRGLLINAGAGDDAITFANWTGTGSPLGAGPLTVTINGGSGADSFSMHDVNLGGRIGLNFDGGSGNDSADIEGNSFTESLIFTNAVFTLRGGAGADTFSVTDNVANSFYVTVYGGGDADSLAVSDNQVTGRFSVSADLGDGNDALTVEDNNCTYTVNLQIDGRAGADQISVNDNVIAGRISFSGTGGTGADSFDVRDNQINAIDRFSLDLGEGDDAMTFANNTVNQFNQTMTVYGRGGADTISATDNVFTGALRLVVETGAGSDSVYYANNDVAARTYITIDLGNGNDWASIVIPVLNPAPASTPAAPNLLVVRGGAGNDTISIEVGSFTVQEANLLVFGDSGDDVLSLRIPLDSVVLGVPNALIDGGTGTDRADRDTGARIINCER